MQEIFVVTHPQSIHHVEGRVGGWYDTGLTELGERQATAIADRLGEMVGGSPAVMQSSDLLRCSQTAERIADRLGISFSTTQGLRELSYGIAEGRPQDWLDARRLPVPDTGRLQDTGGIEGAESRLDIATRVHAAMESFHADTAGIGIVVTHGFALTFVLSWWIGMPVEATGDISFPVASGSITRLRQDRHWKSRAVITLGDTSHLAGLA